MHNKQPTTSRSFISSLLFSVGTLVSLTTFGCAVGAPEEFSEVRETSQEVTHGTTYEIKIPLLANKCVDVNNNSSADGANVQQWTCNGSAAQKWVATDLGNGYFALEHQGTGRCLNRDTSTNNGGGGGNVHQWDCQWAGGSYEYQWQFQSSNGYQRIVNRQDGRCLDVSASSSNDGANIQTWSCNGTGAQTFNPIAVGGGGGGGGGATSNRVVSYIPSWNSGTSIPYSKLTHINVSFAVPNSTGGLAWPDNWAWIKNTVVPNAHANNVKVLIAVGGWMSDSPGAGIFDSAIKYHRGTLVNNIMSIVNDGNLDGIDVDFEYPGADITNEFTWFIQDLRNALGSNRLLTAAVAANDSNGNAGNIQTATFGNFNFINIMAYDDSGSNHATYAFAQNSLNYWTGRGLPAEKAVLGVPFYGRGISNWGSSITYAALVGQNSANACQDSNGTYGYNGIPTIRSKGTLSRSYGGAMFWEQSNDSTGANSLTTALSEAVKGQAGSYDCSGGGGGGGSCGITSHSSAGPCGWWSYNDCCTEAQICAMEPGCVP